MRRSPFGFLGFAVFAVSVLFGCGESTPPSKTPHEAPPGEAKTTTSAASTPITNLRRTEIKETIRHGVGAFLQNVTVDDWPVMHGNKFYGFKIRTLNPEWGIDLKPGDVVTRINGIVPERPEEADAALRSLETASALKIEYERDGKPRTLELPIVD